MADIRDLYGQPVTDYGWLFENNAAENADALARVNAVALSVLDNTSGGTRDPRTFLSDYEYLKGAPHVSQDQYVRARTSNILNRSLELDISRILTASQLSVPTSTVPVEEGGEAPESPIDRVIRRARDVGEARDIVQESTGSVVSSDSSRFVLSAINAYRNTDTATKKARIEADFYDMLRYKTLNRLGYDPDQLLSVEMIPEWAKIFVPGEQTYELVRYASLLDMAEWQRMSTEEQMAAASAMADKLVSNNASPIVALNVLERLSPEGSIAWESTFAALDLLEVGVGIRAFTKATRLANRARILKKYKNVAGAASSMGDKETAARLNAIALMRPDPAVERATGLDRTTAAMNASPFPYQALDSSVTDGIAADVLKYIEDERMVQNYYINRAVNKDSTITSGFFRPEERAVAQATIMSRLPNTAEIVERTPFGVQVRVTTKNAEAFTSPEELAKAEKRYDAWSEAYQQAVDELDRFYSEAVGKFEPDATWVNRLEGQKQRARKEMDDAYRILQKGIEPDKIEERFVWYTRNQLTGQMEGVLEADPLTPKLLSPQTVFQRIDSKIVPERTEIISKQEQLHKLYKEMYHNVLASVSGKQSKYLNSVLLYGDDLGKKFTPLELSMGVDVPGVGTVILNKKGIAGYYKARDLLDSLHNVRSWMKYRRLGFDDYKQIKILVTPEDGSEVLRQHKIFVQNAVQTKTLKSGDTSITLPPFRKILDARDSTGVAKVVDMTDATKLALKEEILKGKTWLVRMNKNFREGSDSVQYALVKASKLEELTPDVLPYRTGYVPRIYERIPYVVRSERLTTFDGIDKQVVKQTERFFGSKKEAEAWALEKTQQDGIKYIADSDYNWRISDPEYAADVNEAVFSGLYEDARGNKILYGATGQESPRVGAFDAIDKYLENLSWNYPLNEWRQAVLQRYFNTANKYLETPNDIRSLVKDGTSNEVKNALYALRDYLRDQLGILSPGERGFSRLSHTIAERMEDNLFFNKVAPNLTNEARLKLLYGADNWDGYGAIKGLAFHAYLGFANLSQLLVQAANAVVIFSMHPTNAPSVMRRILSLRMVAYLSPADPRWESATRIAAKAALMKHSEFESMARALARSGYAYTTRASADAALAMRGMAPGGDLKHIGRFLKNMAIRPFEEGELIGRLYGFIDSYTRIAKKTPGVDMTSPDMINNLIREATRVGYNYTKANAAYWQKGPLSIPTQFLQVPAKFYESVFLPIFGGKRIVSQFSRMERTKQVIGQIALFGALGIPFGPYIKDAMYKYFTTPDENGNVLLPDVDENEVAWFSGGLVDGMMSYLFSAITGTETEVAFSQRIALANGFDILIANFSGSDPDLSKALTGAAGGIVTQRAWPVVSQIARVHGTQMAAGTYGAREVMSTIDKLASITSTWNNIHRARLWERANMILSREGTEILPIDPYGEDRGLLLAKKLGLGSYKEIAAYRLRDWNQKNNPQAEINAALKTADQLLLEYVNEGYHSVEGQDLYSVGLHLIRESLPDEKTREEFDSQWASRLFQNDSLAAKEYKKLIEKMMWRNTDELAAPPIEVGLIDEVVEDEIRRGN